MATDRIDELLDALGQQSRTPLALLPTPMHRLENFGHALKNTLVPVITIIGLNVGSLLAFSIITETVFQWPGMGFLFIQAVGFADIPVMAAYLVLVAVIFVFLNLFVDILYFVVDPRLRADKAVAAGNQE